MGKERIVLRAIDNNAYPVYTSEHPDGWMMVYGFKEGGWLLQNAFGIVDKDQYRHDLAERNNIELLG